MKQSRLAQRKLHALPKEKSKKRNRVWLFLIPIFFILTCIFFGVWHFGFFSSWDGISKMVIAAQSDDGATSIIILDPQSMSITDLHVPMNTQVEAANQLGVWKLGSIGKLARDKGLSGEFLKNTIIKSFNFPIDAWGNGNILDFTSHNIFKIAKSIFANDSTNLTMLDKIRIGIFSLKIGNTGRTEMKLEDTSYLIRSALPDGSLGYTVSDNIPPFIEAFFVDTNINLSSLNVLINNEGAVGEDQMVVKTIEVLGANVASIQTLPSTQFNCRVTGEKPQAVLSIARVFSCDTNFNKPINNFDIQIDLGADFNNRF